MKFCSDNYSVHVCYVSRHLVGEILSVTSSDESKTFTLSHHRYARQYSPKCYFFRVTYMCKKIERKIYSDSLSFRIYDSRHVMSWKIHIFSVILTHRFSMRTVQLIFLIV